MSAGGGWTAPAQAAGAGRSEQPTAPYLDALVGYGFRGPGRFHVPGHKGGEGADPGLRFAVRGRHWCSWHCYRQYRTPGSPTTCSRRAGSY